MSLQDIASLFQADSSLRVLPQGHLHRLEKLLLLERFGEKNGRNPQFAPAEGN